MRYICFSLFLCLWAYKAFGEIDYPPWVSVHVAAGQAQMIEEVDAWLPVWQKPKQLLYVHGLGQMRPRHSWNTNVGLGYRRQFSHHMVGFYGYADRYYKDRDYAQLTLGVEWWHRLFEVRANCYSPINSTAWCIDKKVYRETKLENPYRIVQQVKERYLLETYSGVDIALGAPILNHTLYLYGGYYHFTSTLKSRIHGQSIRGVWQVWGPLLHMVSELQYDKTRGMQYRVGIQFRWLLGRSRAMLSPLKAKMIEKPMRNPSIMVVPRKEIARSNLKCAKLIRHWSELAPSLQENLAGTFLITTDLDAVSTYQLPHKAIGSFGAPFRGALLGVELTADGEVFPKQRTITNLNLHNGDLPYHASYVGLLGRIENAKIKHLTIYYDMEPSSKTSAAIPQYIGALVAYAYNSLITHTHTQGTIHNGRSIHCIGGLGGKLFATVVQYSSSQCQIYSEGHLNHLGGLAGSMQGSVLEHSHAQGHINNQGRTNHLGLLIGGIDSLSYIAFNCARGTIHNQGEYNEIGGLIGATKNTSIQPGIWHYSYQINKLYHSKRGQEDFFPNTIYHNYIDSTIHNIGHYNRIGASLGYMQGCPIVADKANGGMIIQRCFAQGQLYSQGNNNSVGGFVGQAEGGLIVHNSHRVQLTYKGANNSIGGVIGACYIVSNHLPMLLRSFSIKDHQSQTEFLTLEPTYHEVQAPMGANKVGYLMGEGELRPSLLYFIVNNQWLTQPLLGVIGNCPSYYEAVWGQQMDLSSPLYFSPWVQQALKRLQQANSLRRSYFEILPLELQLMVFNWLETELKGLITVAQSNRIYFYSQLALWEAMNDESKPRKLWTKYDFLSYVETNRLPV